MYSTMVCSVGDIKFEIVSILYNIGALHSILGAADDRTTPEGLKLACTHFQCAAWAFQVYSLTYIFSIYQFFPHCKILEGATNKGYS